MALLKKLSCQILNIAERCAILHLTSIGNRATFIDETFPAYYTIEEAFRYPAREPHLLLSLFFLLSQRSLRGAIYGNNQSREGRSIKANNVYVKSSPQSIDLSNKKMVLNQLNLRYYRVLIFSKKTQSDAERREFCLVVVLCVFCAKKSTHTHCRFTVLAGLLQ